MAKRKIRIDPLDPDSIELGLKLLDYYKKSETEAIQTRFPIRLCEKACEIAREAYENEPVTVDYRIKKPSDNGVSYSIYANGDEICFIEFGAGVFANPDLGFAPDAQKVLGFRVAPGSWSMSSQGKKHFLETDRADDYGYGKGPIPIGEWEYNREANNGLFRAYMAITDYVGDIAKEIFL